MTNSTDKLLNGAQAAKFLGVKPATLYAYVSRGLINSIPGQRPRERAYRIEDLKKLRQSTRGFKTVKDSDEPTWTGPVIKSAITEIREDGHFYRGQNVIELVRKNTSFKQVTEILWETSSSDKNWTDVNPLELPDLFKLSVSKGQVQDNLELLKLLLVLLESKDPVRRHLLAKDIFDTARKLILTMPVAIGLKDGHSNIDTDGEYPIARSLLTALTGSNSTEKTKLINSALVLCADHELNASALSARIAASCDASLYSCLLSALSTFSGTLHGSASRRAEDIVTSSLKFESVTTWLKDYLMKFESIPGFGTQLYEHGDPRAKLLIEMALSTSSRNKNLKRLVEIVECVQEHLGLEPNLDVGLAAMSYALSLKPGSGTTIFAVSRAAGWIAHAKEQRRYGGKIRPRARYIGIV